MTAIEEIKARIDVAELIGETVRLRHSGKNYTGFCPFHHNVRTPSFAVFPESGTWRCFGACNEGGDIFRFVMKKEGVDFPEALRRLAERAGVELRPRTQEEERAEEEHARLRTLLELAATFFRNHLLTAEEGRPVLEYLRKRGFSDATLETFHVGLAPSGWEQGIAFFRGKDYSDADLTAAGLAVEGGKGGLRDRFRRRITIPIRDARGRICGFGARVVYPQDQPKFLNSPQTALFDKGRLLFGLDRAARAIRAAGEAVLVEGYMDVMAVHQAGFENVVSPMGTAITEKQLRLLKRNAQRIVLALDPDAAGNAATLRGLELARETLVREGEPVFDARGLLRFESRLQTDLRVATMPGEMDPDEVVQRDPEEWKRLIAEARPLVMHVFHALLQGRELDDPKTRAMIAARMLPLLGDVENKVERETYAQHIARTLRIDDRMLLPGGMAPIRGRRSAGRKAKREEKRATSETFDASGVELLLLGLLLNRPDILFRLDRRLAEQGLERIRGEDFLEPGCAALIELIREAALQGDSEPEEYIADHAVGILSAVVDSAQQAFQKYHSEETEILDEAIEPMLLLRQRALARQMTDLQFFLMEIEQPADNADPAETESARKDAYQRMNRIREGKKDIQRALADRLSGEAVHTGPPDKAGDRVI